MNIKKFFFTCVLIFMAHVALAAEYPDIGYCTGNNVRLRESPSTSSNILGNVNESAVLILLGHRQVNGQRWYKIEHPAKKGTAWIFGDYIESGGSYDKDKPSYETLVKIMSDYGLTPDKARAIFGKPRKTKKQKYFFDPANRNINEEILEYKDFNLQYIEGRLMHVDTTSQNFSFGEINIGDSTSEVLDILGEPDGKGNEGWSYEATPRDVILFEFRDGSVARMTFDHYID